MVTSESNLCELENMSIINKNSVFREVACAGNLPQETSWADLDLHEIRIEPASKFKRLKGVVTPSWSPFAACPQSQYSRQPWRPPLRELTCKVLLQTPATTDY